MEGAAEAPAAYLPRRWLVCFHRGVRTSWVRWIPGRYKHVSAIGFMPEAGMWVFFDPALSGTRIWAARDDAAGRLVMAQWMEDALVVGIDAPTSASWSVPIGGWCVPAVARLVGVKDCALRPDGLLRLMLRKGGVIVVEESADHGVEGQATAGAAGPRA